MLEVRLLGSFRIQCGKKPVEIASRPAQSLFAFLVLNAGTAYRREKLAGLFWPDSPEESARDYLRHALWRIRRAFQAAAETSYLKADDFAVSFDASKDYWLDAKALRDETESKSPDELMQLLADCAGEFLPGFYDEWVMFERENLQTVYERKVEDLLDQLQSGGRWQEVIPWAERWIALGQRPETAYRHLMISYAAQGDAARAAATFERCVKSLAEYGVEPSSETSRLYDELKAGRLPAQSQSNTKSTWGQPTVASNLPTPITSFIGREKEIGEVRKLLETHRLVTLTGSGGVGKTRLAIKIAQISAKKFRDGVFWVDLASLNDAGLVPQVVAKVFNLRAVTEHSFENLLIELLGPMHSLVVLDNCEHLIMACAQLAGLLLTECRNLKMLITSREALEILGETTWSVPSLSLPSPGDVIGESLSDFESIRLFVERAASVSTGFSLSVDNAAAVEQICTRLNGIPLAIELAAARVKMMDPLEIAGRLDDRFELLTAGSRTAVPRQRTLRATIDWSYDLLSTSEKTLFQRLSVFNGGFVMAAAERVGTDDKIPAAQLVELVGQLINKSLLYSRHDSRKAAAETRYAMLETIHEYGRGKLKESGEEKMIQDRHLEYYVRLAEQAEPHKFGERTAEWFSRLDQELNNIRNALDWANQSGRIEDALLLLGGLDYAFFVRGPITEWEQRLREMLAHPGAQGPTYARAKALNGLGMLFWANVNGTDDYPALVEALEIAEQLRNLSLKAKALRNLGLYQHVNGNLSSAKSFLEQSLQAWAMVDTESSRFEAAWTLAFLGDVSYRSQDLPAARANYVEAAAIFREYKDKNFLAYSVRRLGQLATRRNELDSAVPMCRESLLLNIEIADPRGILASVAAFGGIQVARGDLGQAALFLGAVHELLGVQKLYRLLPIDQIEYSRNLDLLAGKLTGPSFERAWSKGRNTTIDQIIEASLAAA